MKEEKTKKPGLVLDDIGRILLMDDNETIRYLVPRMLKISGYYVDVAADGEKAVSKYKEALRAGKKFDVVIMDLTIPGGMGGKEAVRKIKEIDPDAKVIASSGYSNDPVITNHAKFGFSATIVKPYTNEEMQNVLSGLLKEKNGKLSPAREKTSTRKN